jgi:hypothetical protein
LSTNLQSSEQTQTAFNYQPEGIDRHGLKSQKLHSS